MWSRLDWEAKFLVISGAGLVVFLIAIVVCGWRP